MAFGSDLDQDQFIDEREQGTAAKLLYRRGHHKALGMLMACNKQVLASIDDQDWGVSYCTVVLVLDADHFDEANDEEALGQIAKAFHQVWGGTGREANGATVRPALVHAGWRENVERFFRPPVTNQAQIAPLPTAATQQDRLWFRDKAEVVMYEALKAKQKALPSNDTITIVPNPGVYILGRTWEPDFIVTYKRQAAIIEVDGATHTKKWAADQSRDALFEDSGIKFVRHIDVADAENPQRAAEFVDRFIGLFDR